MKIPRACSIAFLCVAGAAGAQTSTQIYGSACATDIGAIDVFDCANGVAVPVTVDGVAVTDHAPATCDRPALLNNGAGSDGQCVPFSRILNLSTETAQIAVMCRQKRFRAEGSTDFDEIDVIAHNPDTGATCWFQAKADAGAGVSGQNVPSPTAATDASFWQTPEAVVAEDCGVCHDNDPFMYSPFVGQVWADVPVDPFGPYGHVDPGIGFSDWPLHAMNLRDNTCLSCHRIGAGLLMPPDPAQEKPGSCGALAQWMTGQVVPVGADEQASRYPASHAMPPNFGRSEAAWNVIYAQSAADIQSCCADPGQDMCGLAEIQSYLDRAQNR
ncbi:hypothetical protein TG4357_01886 [Thalassovita gelatinovora]|uniref:Cytochrome c domain-containing protein n=1 Tax=Thalassovita gelatinovora TaxID=53501 RepID=A0A0P1FBA1_THAGE|nr:hypothetical protein [Thalassovita gelatinovora]QIZ80066.1 hypothetical protein HFZ77_06050 [Thalassovita gelatinovora]CUH65478.1 hypothetical protein TG4357_01886 [Thalassovita gelatinovora]SER09027.1 hypothetical protein SAMN04488043_11564 [Thalassovita gelatinovora]